MKLHLQSEKATIKKIISSFIYGLGAVITILFCSRWLYSSQSQKLKDRRNYVCTYICSRFTIKPECRNTNKNYY